MTSFDGLEADGLEEAGDDAADATAIDVGTDGNWDQTATESGSDSSSDVTVAADASGDIDAPALQDEGASQGEAETSVADGAPDSGIVPTDDSGQTSDSGAEAEAGDATLPGDSAVPSDSATSGADTADACAADVSSDPNNCGTCGHSCLGGTCVLGDCQPMTLATTHGSVAIAVDSTNIYWADNNGDAGAINKLSKTVTHSTTPTAVASGAVAQNVGGVACDGTYVYWTNKTTGQVNRALPTGKGLTTLATAQSTPDWIASNGTVVAWADEGTNQLMAVSVNSDGGLAPTVLNPTGDQGTQPAGIAIDNSNVYYVSTETGGSGVVQFASIREAGAPSLVGFGTYVGIAVDSNNVYWTGGISNQLVSQNAKSGTVGTAKTIASSAAGALLCPLAIASDGTNVYFMDQGSATCAPDSESSTGALYRVPVGNTGPLGAPLVSGLVNPQGLAVDSTTVFWVTGGATGSVMKLAK